MAGCANLSNAADDVYRVPSYLLRYHMRYPPSVALPYPLRLAAAKRVFCTIVLVLV
jgi:hypothetical protein